MGIAAGRVLRRWYRADGLIKQVTVVRVEQATGRISYRRSSKRKGLFPHNRGFITVNNGPAFASQLARYLTGSQLGVTVASVKSRVVSQYGMTFRPHLAGHPLSESWTYERS